MQVKSFAALALIAATSVHAQTAPVATYAQATPIAGSWSYRAIANGSEAVFANAAAQPQLTIRCTRTTRRVSIAKPATGAAPFLFVWTSSNTRNLPASFQPTTAQLVADLAAMDPILDAITFSRGRFAVSASGSPPLVLPAWPELTRVVEDCRV
jgi:hypothetical protein